MGQDMNKNAFSCNSDVDEEDAVHPIIINHDKKNHEKKKNNKNDPNDDGDKTRFGRNKIKMKKYLNAMGRYECDVCHKSYARYNDLRGHFVIHDEATPKCPFCGKKFSRPIYLRDHIRSHKGEKPYCRTICHRRFTAKRNLTHHLKTHKKEKQNK